MTHTVDNVLNIIICIVNVLNLFMLHYSSIKIFIAMSRNHTYDIESRILLYIEKGNDIIQR
jgi:hypothetical protein